MSDRRARGPRDPRQLQLARIHMGKKQLGLGEREYRALLVRVTADAQGIGGLDTCAHMSTAQRNAVLAEMARLGFKAQRNARAFPGRPKNIAEVPMLRKVEALLADSKRPWSYAHHTATHMFNVKRVEWLRPEQLHKLVAALQTDADRRARRP